MAFQIEAPFLGFKNEITDSVSNSFKKIREIYYSHKSRVKDIGQMFDIYEFKEVQLKKFLIDSKNLLLNLLQLMDQNLKK